MKKIYRFLITITILFFSISPAVAWDDCPKGLVNDPYPGSCAQYIDTNNNGICDHSEPNPNNVDEVVKARLPDGQVGEVEKARYTDQSNTGTKSNTIFLWLPLIAYFFHWFLAHRTKWGKKQKLFSVANFRLCWNILLTASFLPVGISGLIIYFGLRGNNSLFWHNQLGVVMVVIAFLHLFYRLSYFKSFLKNKTI